MIPIHNRRVRQAEARPTRILMVVGFVFLVLFTGPSVSHGGRSKTPSPAFDFSLSNGGNLSVVGGSSIKTSISATLTSGSSQSISFSVAGLPTGAAASFSSLSCKPTCSSTLTINALANVASGTFPISVKATGGGITRSTSLYLTTIQPISTGGGSWSYCAQENQTCLFSGVAQVRYGANGSYFYQTAGSSIGCNNATFGDPLYGVVKHCDYTASTLSAFDFSLSTNGSKSVSVGSSVASTVTANLASGAAQSISFSVSGLPSGTLASFSSGSCTPNCSTVLNVTTSGSTPPGSFPITVAATGGGITRTTSYVLTTLSGSVSSISNFTPTNTYYVATYGTDGYSCSQAQSASTPKRTINGGLDV